MWVRAGVAPIDIDLDAPCTGRQMHKSQEGLSTPLALWPVEIDAVVADEQS